MGEDGVGLLEGIRVGDAFTLTEVQSIIPLLTAL